MSKRIKEQYNCPFCGDLVKPCHSKNNGIEYSLTKQRTRIWFHRFCYLKNTRGHKDED